MCLSWRILANSLKDAQAFAGPLARMLTVPEAFRETVPAYASFCILFGNNETMLSPESKLPNDVTHLLSTERPLLEDEC
jgi:hypothetical protein